MTDDAGDAGYRREYVRRHAQARRAAARQEGARRIDVTLKADALDNYATVRRYIEAIDKLIDRNPKIPRRHRPISDTDVINWALNKAAEAIWQNEEAARHQMLADPSSPKDA
jgi:hypothetical protein